MQWADSIEETSRTSKVPAGVIQGPWRWGRHHRLTWLTIGFVV